MVMGNPIEITVNNITEYLYDNTSLFSREKSIEVTELNQDSDPYAEGYVNYVFRVSQGDCSYILKQARIYLKAQGIASELSTERNYIEYLTFLLRGNLLDNKYVPKILHVDQKNNLFIMEDLSYLKIMRFQLSAGKQFPLFPVQIAEFMAKNHFYTSELYLSKPVFCELGNHFNAPDMRTIMEDIVLMKVESEETEIPSPLIGQIGAKLWKNPKIRLEIMEIRDIFMKKWECLIHGDLHTSNIFINQETLCVIDMEYSFIGPFGYDLGYLLANFTSQFAAFNFKNSPDNWAMQEYCLHTIQAVLEGYFRLMRQYFFRDGKDVYKNTAGYIDRLCQSILQDAIGFMASANFFRTINAVPYPDFDCIKAQDKITLAKALSVTIDMHLLLNRKSITTPAQLVEEINAVRDDYILACTHKIK